MRQQKTGDVAGGDEQQKRDRGNQQNQGLLEIRNNDFVHRLGVHPEMFGIITWMEGDDLSRDDLNVGRCRPQADISLQNCRGEEKKRLVVIHGLGHGGFRAVPIQRNIKIGAVELESWRHDPDNRARLALEHHGCSEDGFILVKHLFPIVVVEKHDQTGARLRILFRKTAP